MVILDRQAAHNQRGLLDERWPAILVRGLKVNTGEILYTSPWARSLGFHEESNVYLFHSALQRVHPLWAKVKPKTLLGRTSVLTKRTVIHSNAA